LAHLIRQLGYVSVQAPDPAALAADLTEIVGMRIVEERGGTVFLSCLDRHHDFVIKPGRRAAIAVGLEAMDAAAVEEVTRRLRSANVDILSDRPSSTEIAQSITFKLPSGPVFEVHTPVARIDLPRHWGARPRPRRIEHINVHVDDANATHSIMVDILEMKLSDQTNDAQFRWYRAHDGYHHTVAIGPGDGRLHHYAFDMHSIRDLSSIADNLAGEERSLIWGPGRHGAGGNIFTYFLDVNGCVVESSVEMDRIENDDIYRPRSWDVSEGLSGRWINLWGGPPAPAFFEAGLHFTP
jgi:catechol 2,3-dioxygenase